MAAGVTTDESKAMCVADGTRSPSMRARTPTKLDSFARCRAPITDCNRGAVLRFQVTKSDARHHYHHLRPFARFQPSRVPFRSASSLPVAPFPSAARPCPCPCPCPCALRNLDFSVDISAYVRVTTRHEAKTPGKHVLTTLRGNFFRCETLIFGMRQSFRRKTF